MEQPHAIRPLSPADSHSHRTSMLLFVLAALLGWCLARFFWSRRAFYSLSWRMPGPFALPLVGNAAMFVDSTSE